MGMPEKESRGNLLFSAEAEEGRNVFREYNRLVTSSIATISGQVRYSLWKAFGQAGHIFRLTLMSLAKERCPVAIRAYEGHLMAHDPLLKDSSQCSKPPMAAMPEDYVRECCRDIEGRSAEEGGKRWVELRYDEIVAAFYSDELIVLRFCWGEGVCGTYDAIIARDGFELGTPEAFLAHVEPLYKGKPVSERPREGARLTNYSANPLTEGPQLHVRIFDRRQKLRPWLRKALSRVRGALMPKRGTAAERGCVEEDGDGRTRGATPDGSQE